MWLFYFLFWTAVRAREGPLYGKIGDKAVLTPDSEVNPITSIEWKHGADLAMEWYGGETVSYRHFKVRGSLNTSTGELTITGLTPDDSGSYTVEINNKVTSKTQLLVISPVSKPTISEWCEPEMTYCVLTCNGDTTDTELVTYRWTSGDTTLSSNKKHNITMENKEPWFSCAFENPVSSSSSEIVFNPFIKDLTWIYIIIAVFTLVTCIVVIITIYFRCRRRTRAAERARQEREVLLPIQDKSTQDPTSVVVQDTSNGTDRPASPVVVQETSNQDTTSTGPPETSNETGKAANGTVREMSVMPTPVEKTSTQDLETAQSPDTSNETERPASLVAVEETSPQDKTSTVPPETSNETERSTTSPDVPETSTQDQESAESPDPSNETVKSTISEVNETSTQDLETAESPDTRNETERPASPVVVQETSSQDTTSTGPPETSKETERSTTSPDVPETSTQNQETAESSDPSNETEMSVLIPPVEETSTQDPTSVVVQDTSNGTVNSTISEINETSTQDLETAESPDTSNETERTASLVEETSPQDTTSTGPPEISTETERSATSPDVPETSTQDQETAESPDPSNETETNDQRKPCRNYNEGGCWKGDSCHYRHVCEFALKGNCPNGSNCRLKHPGGTKPQWQFEGDSGTWYEFIYKRGTTECSVNSDEIERKYQKNPNSKMPFTVNRNFYELDFEAKIQINLMTKTRRRVRRVLL